MEEKHLRFVDRLREAAKEHGAVFDLLGLIDDTIMIDGLGNKEIVAGKDGVEWLMAAILAARFAAMDRSENTQNS